MITPIQQAFLELSMHAKIHQKLERLDDTYRDLLQRIEEKEINAYDNDVVFGKLEELKAELMSIRFLTSPSP